MGLASTTRPLRHAVAFILVVANSVFADALPRNWPLPPSELEWRFEREPFTISAIDDAGTGRTGAFKLALRFKDGKTLQVKWKPAPDESLDQWNNSPRRELASYAIQRLFLHENDYVVPTSVLRCIPIEDYGPIQADAKPTLEASRCVLGVLSVWLKDVSAPEPFFDAARFERDQLYARHFSDFNLLSFLINHRDGAHNNLLLSTNASEPRSFSIDNGISFESFPWNMSVINWNDLRVPWVRKASIDRLRSVDEARLESLGVVAEMTRGEDGIFRVTAPGENLEEDEGVRTEGERIQLGLTDLEINRVEGRIERLLEQVDEGKLAVH
jgi:hypothetical protein